MSAATAYIATSSTSTIDESLESSRITCHVNENASGIVTIAGGRISQVTYLRVNVVELYEIGPSPGLRPPSPRCRGARALELRVPSPRVSGEKVPRSGG